MPVRLRETADPTCDPSRPITRTFSSELNTSSGRPLAILSAPGSRGDVNPMLAIGTQLRRRGYDVAISLAQPYAELAEAAGLQPFSLIDRQQFDDMLADPAVWTLLRGMRKVMGGIAAQFLRPHFDLIRTLHRPGRTILVSHPLDFSSRIVRDLDPTIPLVDVHLAPVMLRTPDQPARLTPWRFEPTRHRRTFRLSYWLGDKIILDPLLAGPINRIRRAQGLGPVRRVMHRWWLSPDRVLACYPDWFAPSTVGILPQLRHVGFPLSDGPPRDGGDELAEPPPDRPIVFTGGSANWHTHEFFRQARDVCVKLGHAGLLLGGDPRCFPSELPDNVRTSGYVSLEKLLPHCCAIVHHGGIGTTSQALRAGIPQIIRPLAFDQFDNAERVAALGGGVCLQSDRDLAGRLAFVLQDLKLSESLRVIRSRFGGPSGPQLAADEIDAVMTSRTVPV
ncbi:MurG-like transferase [Stieleria maiorica]|uniref:MurG-like transferase n=1 Tax=Stieleria maiorica TaxID=2795974 RepID=A0A5B9ME22_9BACT|nr:nucleotide disphospho-sugar-binding domain-containing protein [Stieleria maiorica]QEF98486.1 MurG-like transferase [Stieleria maiorica]